MALSPCETGSVIAQMLFGDAKASVSEVTSELGQL